MKGFQMLSAPGRVAGPLLAGGLLAAVLTLGTSPAGAAGTAKVTITDRGLSTTALTVPVGTSVVWADAGRVPYEVSVDNNAFAALVVPGSSSGPYQPPAGIHHVTVSAVPSGAVFHMTVTATKSGPSPTPTPTVTSTSGGSPSASPRPTSSARPPKVAPPPRTGPRPAPTAGGGSGATSLPVPIGALPTVGTLVGPGTGPGNQPVVAPGATGSPTPGLVAGFGPTAPLGSSSPRGVGLPAALAAVLLVGVVAAQIRVLVTTPRA